MLEDLEFAGRAEQLAGLRAVLAADQLPDERTDGLAVGVDIVGCEHLLDDGVGIAVRGPLIDQFGGPVLPFASANQFDALGLVDRGDIDDVSDILERTFDQLALELVGRSIACGLGPVGFDDQPVARSLFQSSSPRWGAIGAISAASVSRPRR